MKEDVALKKSIRLENLFNIHLFVREKKNTVYISAAEKEIFCRKTKKKNDLCSFLQVRFIYKKTKCFMSLIPFDPTHSSMQTWLLSPF